MTNIINAFKTANAETETFKNSCSPATKRWMNVSVFCLMMFMFFMGIFAGSINTASSSERGEVNEER
jgi:hypothetical protein